MKEPKPRYKPCSHAHQARVLNHTPMHINHIESPTEVISLHCRDAEHHSYK